MRLRSFVAPRSRPFDFSPGERFGLFLFVLGSETVTDDGQTVFLPPRLIARAAVVMPIDLLAVRTEDLGFVFIHAFLSSRAPRTAPPTHPRALLSRFFARPPG